MRKLLPSALAVVCLLPWVPAAAGPWLPPGDSAIRHDIQVLADAGVITGPVTTWPLAWGDISAVLGAPEGGLSGAEQAALVRVSRAAREAMESGRLRAHLRVNAAENPRQIRTFEDGPREDGEVRGGVDWTGDRFAFNLEAGFVADPLDDDDWRADGSYVGMALGNWMLAGAITDRWWGPGWQGSLIAGNNSRPIPAFTIERNSTRAFETPWLSWLGPWDLAAFWGFLEEDRVLSNARLFGMRVSIRPLPSLELALSRTAIWCGEGVNCDIDTFIDVFTGDSGGSDPFSEGDQRAGWDARWSGHLWSQPVAFYGSMIGEDSANKLPSSWMGQLGGETTGYISGLGSYRVFLEWADTECDFRFYQSIRGDDDPEDPRCGYNNGVHATGYRYKDRPLGHSIDGDASVFTLGGVLVDERDRSWLATLGIGNLNRRTQVPDSRNPVAEVKTRYRELEMTHKRGLFEGELRAGFGYDYRRNVVTNDSDGDFRLFLDWQRSW